LGVDTLMKAALFEEKVRRTQSPAILRLLDIEALYVEILKVDHIEY